MELTGEVIRGDGYGRKLGYPTVNIDRNEYLEKNRIIVYGVYAGFVTISSTGESYRAGIVVGPEDSEGLPKLEAHLIDFTGDLYGEIVTFHTLEYIRPFMPYETEDNLKDSIEKDIEAIREMDICLPA